MNPIRSDENGMTIRDIIQLANGSGNPQAVINSLAQQNPRLAGVMQMCKGKSPKDVFFEECKRRGVNPDDIISKYNK